MKSIRLLLPVLLALAVCRVTAQTLDSVFVFRGQENVQIDATTVIPDPTPASPTYGGPMNWGITVKGTGLTAPQVTVMPFAGGNNNGTLNPSQHNDGYLGDPEGTGAWRYGSPYFNNIGFPNSGGLDRNARFPVGSYTIAVPGFSDVTLNYQHSSVDLFSPTFTLSGGTWSNGVYLIDPTQTLTITGSPHNGFLTNNVNGAIWHDILDANGDILEGTESLRFRPDGGDDFISFEVGPNTFQAGSDYRLFGGHIYIMDQNAVNGSMNMAFFEAVTTVHISAIPEPSTYAVLAGLGALGLALWRRRQAKAVA